MYLSLFKYICIYTHINIYRMCICICVCMFLCIYEYYTHMETYIHACCGLGFTYLQELLALGGGAWGGPTLHLKLSEVHGVYHASARVA